MYKRYIFQSEYSISCKISCAPSERSACVFAQTDQRLGYPPEDVLGPWLFTESPVKTDQTVGKRRLF